MLVEKSLLWCTEIFFGSGLAVIANSKWLEDKGIEDGTTIISSRRKVFQSQEYLVLKSLVHPKAK
jgi:hypothetical protein